MNTEANFSQEDIDRMRSILAQHDKGADRLGGGMKEFDLNNPPKAAYRHQEYPKHVGYDKKGLLLIANGDAEEKQLALRVVSQTPPAPKRKREKVQPPITWEEDGQVAEE